MPKISLTGLVLASGLIGLSTSGFAENLDGQTIRNVFVDQNFQLTETGKQPVTAYFTKEGELKITYATGAKRTYAWLVRDSGEVCVQKRKATCGWLEKAKTANPQAYVWHQDGKPLGEWLLKPKS